MENGEAQSQAYRMEQLFHAAQFNSMTDMNNVAQLIGYRQRVAQELQKCNDETVRAELNELFDYCNGKIKQALYI